MASTAGRRVGLSRFALLVRKRRSLIRQGNDIRTFNRDQSYESKKISSNPGINPVAGQLVSLYKSVYVSSSGFCVTVVSLLLYIRVARQPSGYGAGLAISR